jgi:hypothetical protein
MIYPARNLTVRLPRPPPSAPRSLFTPNTPGAARSDTLRALRFTWLRLQSRADTASL